MNRNPNPKIIGAFVSLAGILLVGLILFFGSATLFQKQQKFILFFDQSVNGLNVGSVVKFRGVPIGSVERIMIRAEGQGRESTQIPVIIQINLTRLEKDLGFDAKELEFKEIQEMIDLGLVGQLNLESFITGQLFVELGFKPDRNDKWQPLLGENSEYIEIPTLGSPLDQITNDIVGIVTKLDAIDLPRLNENINRVLENLADTLEGIDSSEISRAITDAADSVSGFANSDDLKASLSALRTTLETIGSTVKSYDLEEGPLAATVTTWTSTFGHTLKQLDKLVNNADKLLQPDSTLRFELENALRELARASRSLRELTDYLERNPSAIITGRPESE